MSRAVSIDVNGKVHGNQRNLQGRNQITYNKIRELISDLEHQQWEHWSKAIAKKLEQISGLINSGHHREPRVKLEVIIKGSEKNWKPYSELPEDIKDFDREWANKVLDHFPIKCLMWQWQDHESG